MTDTKHRATSLQQQSYLFSRCCSSTYVRWVNQLRSCKLTQYTMRQMYSNLSTFAKITVKWKSDVFGPQCWLKSKLNKERKLRRPVQRIRPPRFQVLPITQAVFWQFESCVYYDWQATVLMLDNLDVLLAKMSEEDIRADILPMTFAMLESNSIQGQARNARLLNPL